ncbi:MAG: gliding motility-associated C-terminal domain-containing protein [Bacteroidales bacterium]
MHRAFPQGTPLSGVVNDYARIVSIDAADQVTVDDASAFSAGDTVLVIQMKGVTILGDDDASFGDRQEWGGVGKYEFILIASVTGNQVTFTHEMQNFASYQADGSMQLVRVPGYDKAQVTGTLTCDPWDGEKGGVLALFVSNTLVLNANIDVSDEGLLSGPADQGDGACSTTDTDLYDGYFYDASSLRAGNKGEGIVSFIDGEGPYGSAYQKGRGRLLNGGGGGNARYSGGGGGGNMGAGGEGGEETCTDLNFFGGKGGISLALSDVNYITDRRLVMGGGGGASTYLNPGDATDGGNGGGMVIIVADSIAGNGFSILARGGTASNVTTSTGGAGGGGAGGTIALEIRSYHTSSLEVDVSGGKGGDGYCSGSGGGGGGGLIWHTGTALPGNVNKVISGGQGGYDYECGITGSHGQGGTDGTVSTDLDVVITGFLFNTIKWASTNDLTDTICEGTVPSMIIGSEPKGGTTPYSYTWQYSTDQSTWNDISGATGENYVPAAPLADTTWYRRIVQDMSVPQIVDVSKPVVVNVHPALEDYSITFEDTICYNQTPSLLEPDVPVPTGGDGTYAYRWEESPDEVNFTEATGTFTGASYQPPVLTQTMYYRRWVYSGKCYEVSDTVTITVLPAITNNTISADQVICEGSAFALLNGLPPSNGDGTYRFVWEESLDGNTYAGAYGVTDQEDYQPDALGDPAFPSQSERYFRRVVYSGSDDVCQSISDTVTLIQWPAIANNTFVTDQVICEGDIPMDVTGGDASGGKPATYLYQWQDSLSGGTWQDISGANSRDLSFSSPLTDSLFIRRMVTSDVCQDISGVDTISVHPALQHTDIQTISGLYDTTICTGQTPNPIVPESDPLSGGTGIYTYVWEFSTDNGVTWTPTGPDAPDYSPGALTDTTRFRRTVISGQCMETSAHEVVVNVLPEITKNVIPDPGAICSGTNTTLNPPEPEGGAGEGSYAYYWEQSTDNVSWVGADGTRDELTYTTPALTSPLYYRRTVTSGPEGCCSDTSPSVLVDIHPLPTAAITDPAVEVCSGTNADITISLTGTAPWDVTLTDGTGQYTENDIGTAGYQHSVTPETSSESESLVYTLYSVTDGNGCQADGLGMTGQANITVYGVPVADAGPDEEVCGLEYTLQAGMNVGTGTWTFPEAVADVSDNTNPYKTVTVTEEGAHTFTWSVVNGPCPADHDDVTITFWDEVSAVTFPGDTVLEPYANEVELTAEVDDPEIGTYLWSAEPGSPIVFNPDNAETTLLTHLKVGAQTVFFTITNGACEEVYSMMITVPAFEAGSRGLTPNGDGKNDYFRIYLPRDRYNELVIFNRWGNMVYREENFMREDQTGWDGRNLNGELLPEDTYYYIIKVDGDSTRSGFILIRGTE